MSTKNKRFMLTVPGDIESEVKEIKKELFYDAPYSELYRQLIRKGIEVVKEQRQKDAT